MIEKSNEKTRMSNGFHRKQAYDMIRASAGLFDLSSWTKLSIQGPDRITFMHGMVSNTVKGLSEGQGNYSLFLSPKGKMQAELWLFNRRHELFVITYGHLKKKLIDGLNKYLIMDDAEIVDQSKDYALFSMQGPKTLSIIASLCHDDTLPAEEYSFSETTIQNVPVMVLRVPHTNENGLDIVCPISEKEILTKAFIQAGVPVMDDTLWDLLRIEAGIPLWGCDIDDNVIPQEAGLQHALDFQKGCYVGQEVVARLHFRGHVNREWTGFTMQTDQAPAGVLVLHHEGKEVGVITSHCFSFRKDGWIGIGFLRCELREEGKTLTATGQGIEIKVTVSSLPFL